MKAHQNYKNDREDPVAVGRPVNEILSAARKDHQAPGARRRGDNDPLRHVLRDGTPDQQIKQLAMFVERQQPGKAWWSKHWQEFATRRGIAIGRAAEARCRPRCQGRACSKRAAISHRASVRLGLVRMLRLTRTDYWNGKSLLDFDAGRIFEYLEGIQNARFRTAGGPWTTYPRVVPQERHRRRLAGVRAGPRPASLGDRRRAPGTLEAEIQKVGPLEVGREVKSDLVIVG